MVTALGALVAAPLIGSSVRSDAVQLAALVVMFASLVAVIAMVVFIVRRGDYLDRIGLAMTAAWLLAVGLHWIWSWGTQSMGYHPTEAHALAAVLPVLFGWVCLGLYRWTSRMPARP
jgi:MFS superfamily sulfate permease-like transporter